MGNASTHAMVYSHAITAQDSSSSFCGSLSDMECAAGTAAVVGLLSAAAYETSPTIQSDVNEGFAMEGYHNPNQDIKIATTDAGKGIGDGIAGYLDALG